jgi:hypothetical protein
VSRAQLAVLNPDIPAASFVTKHLDNVVKHEEKGQLKFTRNVVCVDIVAPNVSNLTLIDLPGIIRSTEKASEMVYVEAVRSMVTHYISKPNAIIVCTVSAKQEMENTVVRELARRYDPTGKRTLGVITKPDRLEKGAEQAKINVLLGKTYKLELGYYVCRNRTPEELNMGTSFLQARQNEQEFFATKQPWCDLDGMVKSRMGVNHLEAKLTPLLTERIIEALPGLKKSCLTELASVQEQLRALPKPLHLSDKVGVRLALINVLKEFSNQISQHVTARVKDKVLWRAVQSHFSNFWSELRSTAPTVGHSTEDDGLNHVVDTVIIVFSGKHWCPCKITAVQFSPQQPTHTRLQVEYLNMDSKQEWIYQGELFKSEKSRVIRPKVASGSGYSQLNSRFLEYFSFRKLGSNKPKAKQDDWDNDFKSLSGGGNVKTLADIQKVIKEARGRMLPGDVPYQAKTQLIGEFLSQWQDPAETCVSKVSASLQDSVSLLMRDKFKRFKKLHDAVAYYVDELLQQLLDATRGQVTEWMNMEIKSPFTLNLSDLEDCKIDHFDALKAQFLAPPAPPKSKKQQPGNEAAEPEQDGIDYKSYDDVDDIDVSMMNVGPSSASSARKKRERDMECIRVAADVMAYFEIASKRFGDTVPMIVDHQFLIKFSDTVEEELLRKIGVVTRDETELEALLEENSEVALLRKQLKSKESILKTVSRELQSFGAKRSFF